MAICPLINKKIRLKIGKKCQIFPKYIKLIYTQKAPEIQGFPALCMQIGLKYG